MRAGRRIRLNYSDVDDIRREAFLVRHAVAELQNQARAQSPFNSGTFSVMGVEPLYGKIRTIPVYSGRFLNDGDSRDQRRVCVLGYNVKKQLYASRTNIVGTEIRLNGLPFEVIGLMPDKDQSSSYHGMDVDNIYLPYTTLVRDIPSKDASFVPGIVDDLIYVPKELGEWESRAEAGEPHPSAAITVSTPRTKARCTCGIRSKDAEMVDGIFVSMTAFLATIAAVTLSLGGIGVMNIMLVTVTERTPEIGLRKALGATRRRILADFLLEGVLLAGISGAVGWLVSWGLAGFVNSLKLPEMFSGLPVTASTTISAFGALAFVAIASALWPAWKASALTPVEALRYER